MKLLLLAATLIGFIGLSVFGVFSAHIGMQDHAGKCLNAMAQGTDCPQQASLSDYLAFHLNIFRSFSAVLAFSLLVLVVTLQFVRRRRLTGSLTLALSPVAPSDLDLPTDFVHWLSLHENSPSFV